MKHCKQQIEISLEDGFWTNSSESDGCERKGKIGAVSRIPEQAELLILHSQLK